MRILLEAWSKAFQKQRPASSFSIQSLGSSTAPPALLAGTCEIAAMSRKMEPEEISLFEQKFGYQPLALHAALDAVAVVVHPDNPVQGLTLQQLDGIFSSTHTCGRKDITQWSQLFIGKAQRPDIQLYGRNNLSGTYEFFREKALCGGEYKQSMKQLPDSDDIEAAVEKDPAGIGYSGLGYRTNDVRVLAIARNANDGYYKFYVDQFKDSDDLEKRYAWVYRGQYPLTRVLRFYINKDPDKPLTPLLKEFLRFVLSKKGQDIVHKTGYIPLTKSMLKSELKKLDPSYKPSWWNS
jgi:phosphate transport system substrate-binding protein